MECKWVGDVMPDGSRQSIGEYDRREINASSRDTHQEQQQVVASFFDNKVPLRQGQPYFVLLLGAPGNGKSTLGEYFLQQRSQPLPPSLLPSPLSSLSSSPSSSSLVVATREPSGKTEAVPLLPRQTVIHLTVDAILAQLHGFREEVQSLKIEQHSERLAVYKKYRKHVGDALFAQILDRALSQRYSIVYESTGRTIGTTPIHLQRARALGYRLVILFAFVPLSLALQRTVEREKQTGQVRADETFIREAFDRSQSHLMPLSEGVDELYLYDTRTQPPRLLFSRCRPRDSSSFSLRPSRAPTSLSLPFVSTCTHRHRSGLFTHMNKDLVRFLARHCACCRPVLLSLPVDSTHMLRKCNWFVV